MKEARPKGTDSECFHFSAPRGIKITEPNNRVGARGWLGQGVGFLFTVDTYSLGQGESSGAGWWGCLYHSVNAVMPQKND